MVKLIAVDLDGTFLNSKREVSKENIDIIKRIQNMGIRFVTNSGRTYEGVRYVLDQAQIKCDSICMNGGAVYNSEGRIQKVYYMNEDVVRNISERIDHKEYYIEINTNQGTCVTIPQENAEEFIRGWMALYNNGEIECINKEEIERDVKRMKESFLYVKDIDEIYQKGYQVCKIAISHKDTNKILRLREKFSQNPRLSVAASFHTNIEITDKNADKGLALEAYAKENHINMEEIMAFGDSLNDYSMLKRNFGYTVAMGNAIEKIKNTAKYLTKTNDENGVAYFIKENIDIL